VADRRIAIDPDRRRGMDGDPHGATACRGGSSSGEPFSFAAGCIEGRTIPVGERAATGKLSPEEYEKAKSALDSTLQRAIRRQS